MEPKFTAKNIGARLCVYDKYITIKKNILSKDVTIPFKEIISIENGFITLKINTRDKKNYKITLRSHQKRVVVDIIREKISY